jgi:hypothetical protein
MTTTDVRGTREGRQLALVRTPVVLGGGVPAHLVDHGLLATIITPPAPA